MELNVIDHIIAAILIIALPLYAYWEFSRLLAQVRAGVAGARLRAYRLTMAVEWGLAGGVLVVWLLSGRSLETLGLGTGLSVRWWIGAALTLLGITVLVVQAVSAKRSRESLSEVRAHFGELEAMLPHTAAEARTFGAVSVTAGVCEELLYRGFLIAYLEPAAGIWFAVILSSTVFGVGHYYQGTKGIVKTGIVGLVMAGLYQLTGSLWAPIILHASIDMVSGHLGYKAIEMTSDR